MNGEIVTKDAGVSAPLEKRIACYATCLKCQRMTVMYVGEKTLGGWPWCCSHPLAPLTRDEWVTLIEQAKEDKELAS